jgi:N-acetylglucosaminyldiphosphoundecaprenol N-acetyl-beta-D-mannosaminyltransferase
LYKTVNTARKNWFQTRVPGLSILGTRVDATSYSEAVRLVLEMARQRRSAYVCVANVHMVMEGHDAPEFRSVVNGADLVTPDGMPLVWMMRGQGFPQQSRVYGPTLMLELCEAAAKAGVSVGLYGSTDDVLIKLADRLRARFTGLDVGYLNAPPWRSLSEAEADAVVEEVCASGVGILFVGLGCPKQEQWICAMKGRIPAVMLGVGAAFDFHAGDLPQAPALVQRAGMEWFFRLVQEPRRLWRRYLYHNPRFVALALGQLIRDRK